MILLQAFDQISPQRQAVIGTNTLHEHANKLVHFSKCNKIITHTSKVGSIVIHSVVRSHDCSETVAHFDLLERFTHLSESVNIFTDDFFRDISLIDTSWKIAFSPIYPMNKGQWYIEASWSKESLTFLALKFACWHACHDRAPFSTWRHFANV